MYLCARVCVTECHIRVCVFVCVSVVCAHARACVLPGECVRAGVCVSVSETERAQV